MNRCELKIASAHAVVRRWLGLPGVVGLAILALGAAQTPKPQPKPPPPANFRVSGYSLLGNLRLKRVIRILELQKTKPQFLGPDFMEDSALILTAKLRDEGYLQPKITIRVTLEAGTRASYEWNPDEPLPRPMRARFVEFRIRRGVLYHYNQLQFNGLTALTARRARGYFLETSGIVPLKQNRIFSPERLKRSVANLEEVLDRMGYRDAKVTVARQDQDARTGNVAVEIDVTQGPKFIVRSVRQEAFYPTTNTNAPTDLRTNRLEHIYSRWWEQDFAHSVRTNYYARGYPDTAVTLQTEKREPSGTNVFLEMLARITTGPRVRTGDVSFHGVTNTSESMLMRRVPLKMGEWLNRLDAERGQYRLARLGIFDSVALDYQSVSSNLWDVRYDVKEGKRLEISPLFGYGTYDLLRVGVEAQQFNLWGLAHNQDVILVQSFKSSSGDYKYTIPEVFGQDVDVFATANGLRRQEISFLRTEYGGGVGFRKFFRESATDMSLRYNYGLLQASEESANFLAEGEQNPLVGEFIVDARHDRRDNSLYPHRGYELLANGEFASQYLGGDANFERIELGTSYHITLDDSQWIHLGLRHGFVLTPGSSSNNLPFVRRFFPGGEDSVRGYTEGEAAPRNTQGQIVGAETYTTGNVEFEQGITPKWSIVGFVDGVEFAENISDYPGNEALFSVGGGLRWRTIIGPVRLEYGYNLNPRPQDPRGTLQFSLGFPF